MTWNELKQILASGNHYYDPELLEKSPLGLKRYAGIARDARMRREQHLGRFRTADGTTPVTTNLAIPYRMLAGFSGSVNRAHPFSIEPCLIDYNSPPLYYGQGVLVDSSTEGVRPLVSGDASVTDVYGVTVRPFPLQQTSGTTPLSAAIGNATPPAFGIIDVLKFGYIMVQFNNSGSAPVKNGQPYIWVASTNSPHTQGLWETAIGSPTSNTAAIGTPPRTVYQGGWDANTVGELIFHD